MAPKLEVEPCYYGLQIHVRVADLDADEGGATRVEMEVVVLNAYADVAGDAVFDTEARCPAVLAF